MPDQPEGSEPEPLDALSALAELAVCENLAQTSGWAARWGAQVASADGALLWVPDPAHPSFLCLGAWGEDAGGFLRRSVGREVGIAHELIRDREALAIGREGLVDTDDPFLQDLPDHVQTVLAVPLLAEGAIVGLLALIFRMDPDHAEALGAVEGFFEHASPALARALRSDRKTAGMLQAIERLTNLYDVSKAFGSTIDLGELKGLIARKAADLLSAETASLWMMAGDEGEVVLSATAVNDNYDVEGAPEAVGTSVVGDVLAEQTALRRNGLLLPDPLSAETAGYPIRSFLAVPILEDDAVLGALAVANKRGRHPEFTPEDEELLQDLGRQAVRALHTARQHEAEKKVQELDALLAVSREITSTLDLDKVLRTIVNATAALVAYDRCAIGILQKGRLRLDALSGAAEVDRRNPDVRRLEELLQWIFLSGSSVSVTQEEDGSITADRPETEEKFRVVFAETGLRTFYGVLLADEEGKLGALAFESKEPLVFDEGTRDLLQILVNQATVAVRNAQLYQQVPLAGFWKPLLEKRQRLLGIPRRRRLAWTAGLTLTAILLVLVPWRLRIAGPARILPARRAAVTAGVDGIVASVLKREGDRVNAGEVIATLRDEAYQAGAAEVRSALAIAESDVARQRRTGDPGAMFEAQSRSEELRARIALAEEELGRARLRAPVSGVIVTPRLEERVGQLLRRGDELCVVADVGSVTAEVAVPEADLSLVQPGQAVSLKIHSYPTRTFRGTVARLGARVREEGEDRFLIAEVRAENPQGMLKTGMAGSGKISAGRRSLASLLVRKPVRYFWRKLWPLLP